MDEIREDKPVQERLDIYDPQHRRTGRVIFRGDAVRENERLLVAHVCVMNSKNEMLAQKRQLTKGHYSGCWDLTAGGFVLSGEDSETAALRELEEELGLVLQPETLRFLFTEPFSYVLDDYFLARAEPELSALSLQTEEVAEARWIGLAELKEMIADGRFVDYPLEGIEKVFRAAAAGNDRSQPEA